VCIVVNPVTALASTVKNTVRNSDDTNIKEVVHMKTHNGHEDDCECIDCSWYDTEKRDLDAENN
jgi:hypothetical protein